MNWHRFKSVRGRQRFVFSIALLFAVAVHAADEVNLLAFGDWGADTPAQATVAAAMAGYIERNHVKLDAVLALGDNFYVDLRDANDWHWKKLFEQMYDPRRLAAPFYAVLGNHDYESHKAPIELDYAKQYPRSRFKLPARWYRVDLPPVTLIALDSNHDELSKGQWAAETRWLEAELSKPQTTRWTICFAHHPLFSNSQHGDDEQLQRDWGPSFKQHHVDFYLCGHDHCLEHLQLPGWPTSFVVSGGGGKDLYEIKRHDRGSFARSEHGFVHLQFTAETARVRFLDKGGNPVHVFERNHDGAVKVAN